MIDYINKRASVNGMNLHYIVAGEGPAVLRSNATMRSRPRQEIAADIVP